MPRVNRWKGHNYFYEILKGYEKLIAQEPQHIEDLFATPIWFNRTIKTKFDVELSRKGFNFFKDFFPQNKKITEAWMVQRGLSINAIQKLKAIVGKIPQNYTGMVSRSPVASITVRPYPLIIIQGV